MKTVSFYQTKPAPDTIRRSAVLEVPHKDPVELYLEVPASYGRDLTPYNDFLVVLIVFRLIESHWGDGDWFVAGELDERLVRQVEEYSRIWSFNFPRLYQPIRLHCESLHTPTPNILQSKEAIAAFSDGVDACFNLYGHEHKLFGLSSLAIRRCLTLHGADIPLEDQETFSRVVTNIDNTLIQKGLPPTIPVRTNFRTKGEHVWEHCASSVLLASLMMFSGRFHFGSYGTNDPCLLSCSRGLSYETDHLLLPSYFEAYGSGSTQGRTERCSLICRDTILMSHLRVCWQKGTCGGNCGVCEKCQRTLLNFIAAGYRGQLPFQHAFDADLLFSEQPFDDERVSMYEDILTYDKSHHTLPVELKKRLQRELLYFHRRCQNRSKVSRFLLRFAILFLPLSSWRKSARKRLYFNSSRESRDTIDK